MGLGATHDLDIVCEQGQIKACQEVAHSQGWKAFVLDAKREYLRLLGGKENGNTEVIDVAPLQGSSIAKDLALRDCTANAMAVEIDSVRETEVSGILLDPLDGQGDLARAALNPVSFDNLRTDPLRMLRLVRLSHTRELRMSDQTVAFMKANHPSMKHVSGERIREEGWRILLEGKLPLSHAIILLQKTSLYETVFNSVGQGYIGLNCVKDATRGVQQDTLAFLDRVSQVAVTPNWEGTGGFWKSEFSPFDRSILERAAGATLSSQFTRRDWWMRLALLSIPLLTNGEVWPTCNPFNARTYQAALPDYWGHLDYHLKRMSFSKLEAKHSVNALLCLKNLLFALQTKQPGFMECREIHRFIMSSGHTRQVSVLLDVMLLLGSALEGPEMLENHLTLSFLAWQKAALSLLERSNFQKPKPLVSGRDLQNWFGITPGPRVGTMLSWVIEAEACNLISTPAEARRYLTDLL